LKPDTLAGIKPQSCVRQNISARSSVAKVGFPQSERLISRLRLHSGQVIPRFLVGSPGLLNHRAAGMPPLDALNEMGARHFAMIADFSSGYTHNISQRLLV
jgi:hypothetical protein